jgi:hypothetical protein
MSEIKKVIGWTDFKTIVQLGNLHIQIKSQGAWGYELYAFNGPSQIIETSLDAGTNPADLADFNANFLATVIADANKVLTTTDSDGASLIRVKTTKPGWHYEPRSLDFYSSKLNSLYNRKEDGGGIDDGTDYGDASLKFYNASDTELVQGGSETDVDFQIRLDAGCVKTALDWQSTYDFDIIGGSLQLKNEPTDRAYVWCTIAPDIAPNLGGSVPYFAGGINLEFFKAGSSMAFDGRGIKSFLYDPVYNSNKVRFIIKHKAGEQLGLQIMIDQFKA